MQIEVGRLICVTVILDRGLEQFFLLFFFSSSLINNAHRVQEFCVSRRNGVLRSRSKSGALLLHVYARIETSFAIDAWKRDF